MEVHKWQSEAAKPTMESLSLQDLNEDLLIEILCRLPYKFVVQCKCVSKNWFSLICSPQFVDRFSSMNILPFTFVFSSYGNLGEWEEEWEVKKGIPQLKKGIPQLISNNPIFESTGFSFRFLPFYSKSQQGDYPGIQILKTYNDLILCSLFDDLKTPYYICNPLTRQWVSLPPTPHPISRACVDFICESKKDDQKKHHKYIFKVVRVQWEKVTATIKMEIFCSEIGQWNEISTSVSVPDGFDSIHINEAVVYNKKLILLGFMNELAYINIIIDDIFSGGVCSVHPYCVFKIMPDFYPHFPLHGRRRMPEGGLRFARVFSLEFRRLIQIWELGEEGNYEWRLLQEVCMEDVRTESKWVSKYYIKMDFPWVESLEYPDGNFIHMPAVLGFDPYDADILYLHLHFTGRMGRYDIRRRSLNIVKHTWVPFFDYHEAGPVPFFDNNKVFPLVLQFPTSALAQ